jgi:hypothetical protein
MNVPLAGSLHTLGLGVTGLSCNQTNFIPRTVRHYIDCYERGDLAATTSRRPTRSTRTYTASTVSWSNGLARAGRRWR